MTARGELFSRHTDAGGSRWHAARQEAGVWSPYSSPATTVDRAGRLWLAAVRTDGSVPVSSMPPGSARWHLEGERTGSPVTASPAFLAGARGVRVGTVTALGRPVWRRTGSAQVVVPADTVARSGGFGSVLTMILHL